MDLQPLSLTSTGHQHPFCLNSIFLDSNFLQVVGSEPSNSNFFFLLE